MDNQRIFTKEHKEEKIKVIKGKKKVTHVEGILQLVNQILEVG